MRSFEAIFDEDELAELCLGATARIEQALDGDDRGKAVECVSEVAVAKRGFCNSYVDWLTLTYEYLFEKLGHAEHHRAVVPERGAELAMRSGWSVEDLVAAKVLVSSQESELEKSVRDAIALDDRDGALAAWGECERLFRYAHDLRRDVMADLLGWIYTEHGIESLNDAQLYAAERGPWSEWFPAERELPPSERLKVFAFLMCVASFSEIEIAEEHDRWVVHMDLCGTCGRQVRDRYDTGDFHLATVAESGAVTMARPTLTVYQTHLAIIHRTWAIGAVGAPWPGPIECVGLAAGRRPCEVMIYKDPVETPLHFYEAVEMSKPGI